MQHTPNATQTLPMLSSIRLVVCAFIELLRVDIRLARRGFPVVYEHVRNSPVRRGRVSARTDAQICHAVDLACVFYFKQVRCLQHSAAATSLLRRAGFFAEMVIGVQPSPFRAHAWVEVGGRVVNDKPYTSALYTVMERC